MDSVLVGVSDRRPRRTSLMAIILLVLIAFLAVPAALVRADDDDDDDGGGGGTIQTFVLASADTDTEVSLDGTTWQPAVLITSPHPAWQAPVSAWIGPDAAGSSGGDTFLEYRRFFTVPQGCTGTSLTIQVNADNDATVYLNDVAFGSTIPVFSFQEPTETFATPGPFVAGQNTLGFDVRNIGDPTSLDYRAEVTITCDGDDDEDDDDEDDDDEDDDDEDDDDEDENGLRSLI